MVVVTATATIIVSGLANVLPIKGQNTAEMSDMLDVLFMPAGYVFSIWGAIYVGLIAYAVYQALPAQRDSVRLRSIDISFYIASLANIAWILLWRNGYFVLTLVAMVILLISLIILYLRLATGICKPPHGDHWMVQFPFAIYLGWITFSTFVNATVVLNYMDWNGFGLSDETWFFITLTAALVIAARVAWTRGDLAYLMTLVWAFSGIAVKQADLPVVSTASWFVTALALALVAMALYRRKLGKPVLIEY